MLSVSVKKSKLMLHTCTCHFTVQAFNCTGISNKTERFSSGCKRKLSQLTTVGISTLKFHFNVIILGTEIVRVTLSERVLAHVTS